MPPAVAAAVERFGGIDVCVNNASAINLVGIEAMEIKRYDLMQAINTRGAFLVSQGVHPHLKQSANPHILTLSPPIIEPRWLGPHPAYTIAKYGMSLCALGLQPSTRTPESPPTRSGRARSIATAAVQNLLGGDEAMCRARAPRESMADAAYAIITRPTRVHGQPYICEDVLGEAGITDLSATAAPVRTRARRRPLRRRHQPAVAALTLGGRGGQLAAGLQAERVGDQLVSRSTCGRRGRG